MPTFGYLLPTRGIAVSSSDSTELTARLQADVVQLAMRAESLGYDSVWVGDRILDKSRPEPLLSLAAAAQATDAIELGTSVYVPNLRHPVHVAHQTATLDQLSGGRFVLGAGAGGLNIQPEYEAMDVPYERRGKRLNEVLDLVTDYWSGEEVSYDGEFYDVDGGSIGFQPSRRPPIYVATAAFDAGKGFPRTIENRMAEHGDGWLPIMTSADDYEAGIELYRTVVEEAGRDPDGVMGALYHDIVIADSEDEAIDRSREFYRQYYSGSLDDLSEEKMRKHIEHHGAFGTPEDVRRHVEKYIDAGVERFITRFPVANQREQLHELGALLDEGL